MRTAVLLASILSLTTIFNTPTLASVDLGQTASDSSKPNNPQLIIVTGNEALAHQFEGFPNVTVVCSLGQALNLVFNDPNTNQIKFPEDMIDMCKDKNVSNQNINQLIKVDKVGEVTVRSDLAPELNKPADITMRNLPFDQEPDLLVDGKPTTPSDVEDKTWDQATKTLSFHAKHFSTYQAVAAGSAAATTAQTLPTNTIWINVAIVIAVIVLIAAYVVVRKMNKSKENLTPPTTSNPEIN